MLSAVRASTAWAAKSRAVALAAAVLLSLAVAACSDAPPPEPIDLVPADANLVALVDLGRMLIDADAAVLFESVPLGEGGPATLGEALAEFEADTGIDPRQFTRVVVFGLVDPAAGLDGQTDLAMMARGTFDGDTILGRVRLDSAGDLREDEYRGHALLVGVEEDGSETAVTVLADEVLVIGDLGAVTSVIDVLEDGEGALAGPLLDTYLALGDPLVKAAFAVPPGAIDGLGGMPADVIPIPLDLSMLSDITTVGLTADKEADLVTVTVTLEHASAASAEAAAEYLGTLLTLAGPFLPPGAAADLVGLIEISYVESTVTLSITATVDQLTGAAEELGAPDPSPTPG
ncbi:MAG: hypothetical protein J4N32_01100 [Chloroflexi bacterium]|nr:hypothetical protein [Chloroflexota bacterium]